ncbi:MAG: DUF885 domain-containing protein [Gemmatimonadota bacterium]
MNFLRRKALAAPALVAALVGCHQASPSTPRPAGSATQALDRIVAAYESRSGDAPTLPDISIAKARADADSARALLARLDAVDPAGMAHEAVITREILRWEAQKTIQEVDVYWYTFPILPAISPLRSVPPVLAARPIATAADRLTYLTTLAGAGRVLEAMREKSAAQAGRGIVIPREQIDNVLPYLRSFAEPAARNPFRLDPKRLESVPVADRSAFATREARVIDSAIVPAARSLALYVDSELRPRAPEAVGLGQYPGGKDAYRIMVKRETTLDVTPEQVHEIGLRAVDAIEARMQQVRDSLGFKGTKEEFHQQLRRDPRFYVKTPAEVGERLMMYVARIEPRLDQYFARRPRSPYGVRRVDLALEPSMTYGYYNWPMGTDPKGYYNYNGSQLEERSLLMAGAIAYHELVPGHHFQINLARENQALPKFRRTTTHAGYTEGWGEYSSSVVAREMGMYRDAYEVYGRLVFDMFFAVRLVVDTGMNFYGWPRSKAVAYMKEHTLESDGQIDSETLRYSTRSPAQALAYRMGRETFVSLRAKTEQALGPRFDLRRFHDAVLMSGSLPLFVLERHVDWFIEQEKAR